MTFEATIGFEPLAGIF